MFRLIFLTFLVITIVAAAPVFSAETKDRMPGFSVLPASVQIRLPAAFYYREGLAAGDYSIDFGDGTKTAVVINPEGCNGTDLNGDCNHLLIKHAYSQEGRYTATLSRCSKGLASFCHVINEGKVVVIVTADNSLPLLLSSSISSGLAPITVHFSLTDQLRGAMDGVYEIDFGDSNGKLTEVNAQCSANTCAINIDHLSQVSG